MNRELWDGVQARLQDNLRGHRNGVRSASPSLLAGKMVDDKGRALIASHATKTAGEGRIRYRYYISQMEQGDAGVPALGMPAREIEAAVTERIAQAFDDPLMLLEQAGLPLDPDALRRIEQHGAEAPARLRRCERSLVRDLVSAIRVEKGRVEIRCASTLIAGLLMIEPDGDTPAELVLLAPVQLTRSGREVRLVQDDGRAATAQADTSLVRLIVQAHRWWGELKKGEVKITILCEREKVSDAWMTRVLRLAFLSPAVTATILGETQPAVMSSATLLATGAVPPLWGDQAQRLLAAQG